MTAEILPIGDLRETEENWQIYRNPEADNEFFALVESIKENGLLEPIALSADYYILSGHRRFRASKKAGLATVRVTINFSVFIGDLSPAERIQLLISHNAGSRVKSAGEVAAEAMAAVDPEAAMRAASDRKLKVLDKIKTLCAPVKEKGKSSRTSPVRHRSDFLAAVHAILADLEGRGLLPVSARTLHYKLLPLGVRTSNTKKGHPYVNDKPSNQLLSVLLTDARSAGLIDDRCFCDETRPCEAAGHNSSVGEYVSAQTTNLFGNYFSNIHKDQPIHIEIIVEKNTIFPIILNHVARPLRLPVTSARGYLSYPAGCEIRDRFKASGKESLIVVYVSDFDPEGMGMPSSFLKYFRIDHKIPTTVYRACLTREQIERFQLPSAGPVKNTSDRAPEFIAEHGNEVWELDGLDPGTLAEEVHAFCEGLLVKEIFDAAMAEEKANDIKLARLTAAVRAQIPDLMEQAGL